MSNLWARLLSDIKFEIAPEDTYEDQGFQVRHLRQMFSTCVHTQTAQTNTRQTIN